MLTSLLLLTVNLKTARPSWTSQVAGYRLEKWSRQDPDDLETFYIKDRRGHVVTALHDFRITPYFDNKVQVLDLNHDGVPEVLLSTWTGGAHGGCSYYIWSLGLHPRCILAYDKVNIGLEHDFEFVDLDGDGIPEIRTWYDGYYYTVSGSYWPDLPIILKLVHGRYVERTYRFRKVLRQAAHWSWIDFQKESGHEGFRSYYINPINLLAIGDMLGDRETVWRRLRRIMTNSNYRWLKHNESLVFEILRRRKDRYQYPKPYDLRPVAWVPLSEDLTSKLNE